MDTWHFNLRSREGSNNFKIAISKVAADFNPRSREGSDSTLVYLWLLSPYFNPRSREGSDCHALWLSDGHIISIHAPAKGATFWITAFLSTMRFQSTLPRRERRVNRMVNYMKKQFQSTLPRRERPRWRYLLRIRNQFQSTLPRRERHRNDTAFGTFILFQSTLPRRERQLWRLKAITLNSISIHAPAKGATSVIKMISYYITISIHAPAKGATVGVGLPNVSESFQSTLPRRERRARTE